MMIGFITKLKLLFGCIRLLLEKLTCDHHDMGELSNEQTTSE